jgi:predicted Zn-dependent protease
VLQVPIFSKKIDKMSEKDLFTIAMFSHSKQNWKNACEYLDEFVKKVPNNSEARMTLAVSLLNLKKFDDALLEYDHLVSTHPENVSFVAMRALCLGRNNQRDKAISELERSLEMKDDPMLRGLLLRLKGTEILDVSGWGKKHSTHREDTMVPGVGMVYLNFTGFMQEVA